LFYKISCYLNLLQVDWNLNIGEFALDIAILEQNEKSVIVVLGKVLLEQICIMQYHCVKIFGMWKQLHNQLHYR